MVIASAASLNNVTVESGRCTIHKSGSRDHALHVHKPLFFKGEYYCVSKNLLANPAELNTAYWPFSRDMLFFLVNYHLATILKLSSLGVSRLGNRYTVLEKSFINK